MWERARHATRAVTAHGGTSVARLAGGKECKDVDDFKLVSFHGSRGIGRSRR